MKLFKILVIIFTFLFSQKSFSVDLIQIYEVAKRNDPILLESEARHKSIMQSYPIARSALLPRLDFNASSKRTREAISGSVYGRSSSTSQYTTDQHSFDFAQPVYRKDLYTLLKKSKLEVAQSLAERDLARQELIIRVTEAYFDILKSKDQLAFAESELNYTSATLRGAKEKFKLGIISELELKDIQSYYEVSKSNLFSAKNNLDVAKDSIYLITGNRFEIYNSLNKLFKPSLSDIKNLIEWEQLAGKYNLSLIAQKSLVEVKEKGLEYEKSKHYPTIDLVASASKTYKGGGSSGKYDSNNDYIGLQLNVPIFYGGETRYKTKQAKYLYDAESQKLSYMKKNLSNEVRKAYLNVLNSEKKIHAMHKVLKAKKMQVEMSQESLKLDLETSRNLLNSIKDMYEAKNNYLIAKYDFILSKLNLKKTAGLLSVDDLRYVNSWLN